MAGMVLIEPTDLYNILNQGNVYPKLSDPNFLLLLDARLKHEYGESHVVTSKKAPKNENGEFMIPYDAELECKKNVIVYDGNTRNLKDIGPAYQCAQVMSELGSRNAVKILRGGYEDFSALYPFLRTQKIMFMPRELDDLKTYPLEIMPGKLYLGNWRQGNAAYIQKDLKIKACINCTPEKEQLDRPDTLQVAVEDNKEADIYSHFQTACGHIDSHLDENKCVLVFSALGISRSATIVVAYLMHHYKWPLQRAYLHVKNCFWSIRPNRGFIEQLSRFEQDLFGEIQTSIEDPNF